ncbi:MAG: hypothetical protein CL760_08595 [Chloroflexi bacterium]|mgnify:FL=1|nr:hypothetical protein [Chloroflexota bacterium]MQG05201.1 DUF4392 domain-containing protein [SAR202 cluster bacterium]
MQTVEDIILSSDQRGISLLRKYLQKEFCTKAAVTVLDNPGTVIITTGFYIRSAGYIETDGPPGAIAIGRALNKLDYRVVYVTDKYGMKALESIAEPSSIIYEFPILNSEASNILASNICNEFDPSIMIAVERCGINELGKYSNMHGQDITPYTAKIDCLFQNKITSIGIGDGGNEIGMGNLYAQVKDNSKLVRFPTTIEVDELVIASVSNWGAYGLIAAISLIKNQNLLVSAEEEIEIINTLVGLGVVDGMSGKPESFVDGFDLDSNSKILQNLHSFLN